MVRTIAVSERVYAKLKELKEVLGVEYNELIEILIEENKVNKRHKKDCHRPFKG